MRDLGSFRGTNNHGPLDHYPSNAAFAAYAFAAALFAVVAVLIIADASFERVNRAFEIEGRT